MSFGDDTLAPWSAEEKVYPVAIKLAKALLNTEIGVTFHPVRTSEQRTDMLSTSFEQLRELAQTVLDLGK